MAQVSNSTATGNRLISILVHLLMVSNSRDTKAEKSNGTMKQQALLKNSLPQEYVLYCKY